MAVTDKIKIVLVGDYSIFRLALRMLIETDPGFKVVSEIPRIQDILNLPAQQTSDLILIDLAEDRDGSEMFNFLGENNINKPILVLTSSNDFRIYQKCITAGTNGLVLKDKNAEVLFKAIRSVYGGEYWFDRSTMGLTIKNLVNEKQMFNNNSQFHAHSSLSERETQVVNLICQGLKNKEIADRLFITETTVRHHLTSIFEKLAISSRLELVIYAFKHKLVKIPSVLDVKASKVEKNSYL